MDNRRVFHLATNTFDKTAFETFAADKQLEHFQYDGYDRNTNEWNSISVNRATDRK